MFFYFTDRKFNLVGIASTDSDAAIQIVSEKDVLSIKSASRLFEGTLYFSASESLIIKQMAALGNYMLYKDSRGQSVWMTIMRSRHDKLNGTNEITCEDAGMDLINETVGPYKAEKAYNVAHYINKFAYDSGFEIGINEISNLTRKLEWESEESTALARLISVATQFDNAEIDFSFEIDGLEVVKKYINIYKKRGDDNRIVLNVDHEINNIVTEGDIYDLCTSIYATGGTPDGKNDPINLKGYKYTDPNGRFVLGSDGVMRDTESVQKWSRLLSNGNPNPKSSHIQRLKSYETTDQKTLCDNVVRELEKVSQPVFSYEVDLAVLPSNVKIGDTIYLADEAEELFLSARVLEIEQCYSLQEYNAVLGEYELQKSGLDPSLINVAKTIKNSIEYLWTRYADDDNGNGMSADGTGKNYIATKSVKGQSAASNDPADYTGLWVRRTGIDGKPTGVVEQSTVPVSVYDGMLWKASMDILPNYFSSVTYRWNGVAWEVYNDPRIAEEAKTKVDAVEMTTADLLRRIEELEKLIQTR